MKQLMGKTKNKKLKRDIIPSEKESKHEWHQRLNEEEKKIHKEIEDFGLEELNIPKDKK